MSMFIVKEINFDIVVNVNNDVSVKSANVNVVVVSGSIVNICVNVIVVIPVSVMPRRKSDSKNNKQPMVKQQTTNN